MSGLDAVARGLAARARTDVALRSRVLMATGPSGPIYGGTGAGYVTVQSVMLPANAILGGCTLRLRMLLAKYAPFNAGHQWRLRIGGVAIAQNAMGAAMASMRVEQDIHVAHDRKSAYAYNINTLDTPALNTAGLYAATGIKAGVIANLGARQPSAMVMFVANSAPPTVETVLVDFSQPQPLTLELLVQNGDTAELLGATVEAVQAGDGGLNYSTSRATALWGDSLTEGTGATAISGVPMDWGAQLRRQRAGWPIAAKGLGGQIAAQIVDRLVADWIAGRYWNAVLWIGTNDFTPANGGADWFAAIKTQIDRALAFRSSPRTIVCTLHPRASWAVGDASYVAMQAVNAGLAAAYGSRVCDLFAALATNAGKVPAASMSDDIHLTNAGYTSVMQAVDARMTALGWS